MSELLVVNTYRNVPISYDPQKKQFVAMVGGRDVKKPSQSAVEKVILKYQGGGEKKRVMFIDDGYWSMHVEDVQAIGARGSKVLYRRPGREEVDSLDGEHTYEFDAELFDQAKKLAKELQGWKEHYRKLIEKMKKVDVKDLK